MYAVVTCSNGNYSILAEGLTEQAAKVKYHQTCAAFWNAPDVLLGQVAIVNQQWQVVGNYTEQIIHTVEPQEEPQEQGE